MNKNNKENVYILWVSCFFHDSSVSLLKNWKIIFALEEEKLSQVKHDSAFPEKAINKCLEYCKLDITDITYVGFYEKPFIKFEYFIKNYIKTSPFWFYWFIKWLKEWLKYKLWFSNTLKEKIWYKWKIIYLDHHLTHSSWAFFSSWYTDAAILTVDWVWEESTITRGIWQKNKILIEEKISFPNSIWLLYSTFTAYLWFEVNDWEYKMMWLAPYWKPIYKDLIFRELIVLNENWSFELNMKYFSFIYWRKMFNKKFERLFWEKCRKYSEEINDFHKNIASSIQEVTEIIMLKLVDYIYNKTEQDNLTISWWVWLNCVANYKILKNSKFKNIYIQPSPWDWWSCIWICYYIYFNILNNKNISGFNNIYLWEDFLDNQIYEDLLKNNQFIRFEKLTINDLLKKTANYLYKNKIIWWFQWRTEFWPRALGNRSILGNPLNIENWKKINLKIKFRESFRPFAPSIIEEDLNKYFDIEWSFPYMLFIAKTNFKDQIPAVVHLDNTSRVQTVNRLQNKRYYLLLKEFERISSHPILINTSFNLSWMPIVNSPSDAIKTFLNCEMDYLVLWDYFISKK